MAAMKFCQRVSHSQGSMNAGVELIDENGGDQGLVWGTV